MRLPRPLYVLLRIAETLLSVGSRGINAFLPGGSTSISVSARAALEESPGWAAARVRIDRLFIVQTLLTGKTHCQWALDREADLARKTLAQIETKRALRTATA